MREELMSGEEFKKFFNDVVNATLGTKGAPESLLEVMNQHGISPDLPPAVAEKIMPMLATKVRDIKRIPHNCSWCPVCGMCAACGGLNAGSLGACAASAVHVLD
ncbi:MAG: hypothetical protein GXP49_13660 [Deltaproteobacteria bacterium]|nr:hypothetical protein [Deltaproteobacteria bacterium]